MNLYHFIDRATNLVAYADKPEPGDLNQVSELNPDFLIVPSLTGQPNAPRIFPGFLYFDETFWSPQRKFNQVSSGEGVTLDKEDFLRLLTLDEMVTLFNFQDDELLDKQSKKFINTFLRYLDGTTRISLNHPTLRTALDYFVSVGYLTEARKTEIIAVTYKQ